jgi:hypothetical protein
MPWKCFGSNVTPAIRSVAAADGITAGLPAVRHPERMAVPGRCYAALTMARARFSPYYSATADSVTLYVDDAVFSTTGAPGSGLAFTEIGHNPSFSEWFSGSIDNVFVFDEVLSGAEISSIYRGGADAILALADDTPSPISEPGSILLLGTGLGAIGLTVWRRRK